MLWPALMLSYYSFMRAHEFATLNCHGQTLQIKFLVSHNSQRCNPFTQLQCTSQIHLPTLLELLISVLLQSHHEFGLIFHGGRFSSYMAAAHLSTLSLTAATKYSQNRYSYHCSSHWAASLAYKNPWEMEQRSLPIVYTYLPSSRTITASKIL